MTAPPAFTLAVQYASRRDCPPRPRIRRWVGAALELAQARAGAQFVVRFCDSREARALNQRFRGRDYPTNVLTFAEPRGGAVYADIVICSSVVEREARAQEVPVMHHYAHLVVHGVLHALGFDHERSRQAQRMEALEGTILARLRVPDPYRESSACEA